MNTALEDVRLGRNLAETARLNHPATRAGHAARNAVARGQPSANRIVANRRVFRRSLAWMLVVILLTGTAAWLFRFAGL